MKCGHLPCLCESCPHLPQHLRSFRVAQFRSLNVWNMYVNSSAWVGPASSTTHHLHDGLHYHCLSDWSWPAFSVELCCPGLNSLLLHVLPHLQELSLWRSNEQYVRKDHSWRCTQKAEVFSKADHGHQARRTELFTTLAGYCYLSWCWSSPAWWGTSLRCTGSSSSTQAAWSWLHAPALSCLCLTGTGYQRSPAHKMIQYKARNEPCGNDVRINSDKWDASI